MGLGDGTLVQLLICHQQPPSNIVSVKQNCFRHILFKSRNKIGIHQGHSFWPFTQFASYKILYLIELKSVIFFYFAKYFTSSLEPEIE